MRLVTYRVDSEGSETTRARYGVCIRRDGREDEVIDLSAGLAQIEKIHGKPSDRASIVDRFGADLLGFIERARDAMPAAEEVVRAAKADRLAPTHDGVRVAHSLGNVKLLSPLPRPPSMRDGYAFRQHVLTARKNRGLEMIPEFDLFPVFYFTNHQAVVGPGPVRVREQHLDKLDFELEAAIVVGAGGRNLDVEGADAAIFGMTIMNDLSARALQMEEMKLSLGPAKGKDFATALGPWLVTIDELKAQTKKTEHGNVFDLEMRASVNGVSISRGNVRDMNWTFAQILERASYGVTLFPGDVIGSGTVGTGCFLEQNGSKVTNNQWLKVGDVVRLEIDQLGVLENTFQLEPVSR